MGSKVLILSIVFGTIALNAVAQDKKDIVDVAASVEDFSTLVTALKAADLTNALKGEGPFTIFAPPNAGFSNIDSKTLNSLLEPANREQLAKILTYHVISGKIVAEDFETALEGGDAELKLNTLSGDTITALRREGDIYLKDVNGKLSKISSTDLMASNGVIHMIENVIMPTIDEVYCCSNHGEKHCGPAEDLSKLRERKGCKGFN